MQRTVVLTSIVLLGFLAVALAHSREDQPVLERETTRQKFELPENATPHLIVDNYYGQIEIRRHPAPDHPSAIDLELTRTVRGRSRSKLEQARQEVRLEVNVEGSTVDLYVDAPYRQKRWRNRNWEWRDPGYRVIYDFVLVVPERIDLEVKTVSDGDVLISGTSGDFTVANVNGAVELSGIDGSGSAKTVNGGVRVAFRDNPHHNSEFATVNGDVDVVFLPGLEADLRLMSSFGELWSEFEVEPLPGLPPTETIEDGRRVIRTDRGARVRVGAGGASHSFETLTGDVRIRRADRGAGLGES
jgi:hypothetical protein